MSAPDPAATTTGSPRWLNEAEMAAWLPLVQLVTLLPHRLDRQLRSDAGIGHVSYQILAMLSREGEQQLRMSELARLTAITPSRLSHAVAALEERGWVARCPAASDGRGQLTRLTDAGRTALARLAPGHVAEVRRLVFDRLTPQEVDHVAHLASVLLDAASETPS